MNELAEETAAAVDTSTKNDAPPAPIRSRRDDAHIAAAPPPPSPVAVRSVERPPPRLRHPRRVLFTALALGIVADLDFDGRPLGVQFPLFVFGVLAGLGVLSGREGWHGARRVRALAVPLMAFAAFVAVRHGPELTALNLLACAALAGLLVQGFSGGLSILDLRFWEVPGRALQGWLSGLVAAPSLVTQSMDTRRAASAVKAAWRPALKALLVTLPVLAVFVALLASGDAAFAHALSAVLDGASPEGGTVGRLCVVLGVTLGLGGLYTHALRRRTWASDAPAAASSARWLGGLEATCVVYSLVALFGLFAAVQARELFVEHARLIPQTPGVGWGTYAREGFEQLIAASVLTLSLLVALPRLAALDGVRRSFRIGASALVALTLVILTTALNRLVACEEAYGYTLTRLFGHVFGFALGGVLLWRALTVWVWTHRFAVGALAGGLFFVLALDVVDPEAFVIRHNEERYERTGRIDRYYLDALERARASGRE